MNVLISNGATTLRSAPGLTDLRHVALWVYQDRLREL
jgi:hypothetical protein